MSDTPCLESDNHPPARSGPVKFKVEYEVVTDFDTAQRLARLDGLEKHFEDDPLESTESSIALSIESNDSDYFDICSPIKIGVVED